MLNLQKVCDIKFEGVHQWDAPDYVDAYISEAWLEVRDGGFRMLTDEELDWLNSDENGDWRYEKLQDFLH